MPAKRPVQVLSEDNIDALVSQIHAGVHPLTLAKKLHPHDRIARRRTYWRLAKAAVGDPRVAERLNARLQLDMMVGLGPTLKNLIHQASTRRDPANIKLLLEATGFHNTKVQHQHSGEITVKIDVPRPTFVQDSVIDATVVED